jgi:hypothetical protein
MPWYSLAALGAAYGYVLYHLFRLTKENQHLRRELAQQRRMNTDLAERLYKKITTHPESKSNLEEN